MPENNDISNRITDFFEEPDANSLQVFAEPRKRQKITEPPAEYRVGDIYLKFELMNEAKGIEDKVNSFKNSWKGKSEKSDFLKKSIEQYESRFEKAAEDYTNLFYELKNLEESLEKKSNQYIMASENLRGKADEKSLDYLKQPMHQWLLESEILNELKAETEKARKDCFDAYTRMKMLETYSFRIGERLYNKKFEQEFKMFRDSDQLI